MLANNGDVPHWFQPTQPVRDKVEYILNGWPGPPEKTVALHVRRGDYAQIEDGLGQTNQGWLLPLSFYREALESAPREAWIAVFSDDPDWAEATFSAFRPWVSRGNPAAVDMFLIARCGWNVISHSSFSWWAAWLNDNPDKVVVAPKYYLGWRIGRWIPGGIDVPGWRYMDVKA